MPRLRPEALDDRELFARVVDEAAEMTPGHKQLTREVRAAFEHLRELVDDRAWRALLRLEVAINNRHLEISDHLVEWAYQEGQRSAGEG